MPPPPATPAPRAASCFAKEAVRQGRPEPPPPPFQPHPSLRLRQTKGGVLRSHQPSRTQEFLIGGKGSAPWWPPKHARVWLARGGSRGTPAHAGWRLSRRGERRFRRAGSRPCGSGTRVHRERHAPRNAFNADPKRDRPLLGVVFGLSRQTSRSARWLGCLSAPVFRPFRLPLLPLLCERTQLLLSRGNLRSRLLTPAGQGFEIFARG